jgi:transcriptional regulator with XRE-family HTH domain
MTISPSGSAEGPTEDVGSLLRSHRERRGMSGSALAALAGMSQAKVSRLETGRTPVTPEDVRLLADGLELNADETEALIRLAGESRAASARLGEWKLDQTGPAKRQAEIGRAEWRSREIRIFQPIVIAGLLQTSGYAEAVMRTPHWRVALAGSDGFEAALLAGVAGRISRQQILARPDKQFSIVMTESVLSNRLTNTEEMLAQIRKVRELAKQDNVSVRFIEADAMLPEAPLNGFQLIDDDWLIIDLLNTSVTSRAAADIEVYHDIFDSMSRAATANIDGVLDKYAEIYRRRLG